jgi:hypothetical protein
VELWLYAAMDKKKILVNISKEFHRYREIFPIGIIDSFREIL